MAAGERVHTELRACIEHIIGDEVQWQFVDGRLGESANTLYARGVRAMHARRGLMPRGVDVKSTCTVQSRTVTPWREVVSGGHSEGGRA